MDLIKLGIIFFLIIVFLGMRKPIALVMLGATVLLGILFAMPPLDFLLAYGQSLISRQSMDLLLILWLIMILEGMMSNHGYMQHMLTAMDNIFHSRKINIITMPMIIGFLPSVGGALFSAPMVEKAAQGAAISPEQKTIINSHYRHIMETFFPTYPSIILAAQLADISLLSLMLLLFPLTILTFIVGLYFVKDIQNFPIADKKNKWPQKADLWLLLMSLWPFLLLILLIMLLETDIWLAALITLIALLLQIKPGLKNIYKLIVKSTKWRILLMVIAVLAFKDILYASGAVDHLPSIIAQLPIPAYLVFSLSILIVAIITGMTMPAISLILPLALVAMPDADILPLVVLLNISAYVGAQITPMHLCITITAAYFKANLQKVLLTSMPMYAIIYLAVLLFYNMLIS